MIALLAEAPYMAAQLSFLSMTQIQKLSQYQNRNRNQHPVNPDSLTSSHSNHMWNSREIHQEDDDSWEVRAFAEDTNVMGSTWPPRFYRCTFCRRDFRSAQALGGHMNVHRRDRARLHQVQPSSSIISSSPLNSSHVIPTREFFPDGGLCSFYQIPKPSNAFTPTVPKAMIDSSSKFHNISAQPKNNLLSPLSMNLPVAKTTPSNSSYRYCGKTQEPSASSEKGHEELDLELRLGQRRRPA